MLVVDLFQTLVDFLSLSHISFLLVGLVIGIILGATPGVGGVLGMAIVLPLTLGIDGISAVLLLVSIYLGSLYGGAVSAILMNVPGTSAAIASTFDGYPLAQKGRGEYALAISAIASALGGIISAILLIILTPFLVSLVLRIGTVHYFLIAVLGIALLPLITQGSHIKGLFAGAFGLLITTIGVAPTAITVRYDLGQPEMYNGLDYIAILIGLFAITEMIVLLGLQKGSIVDKSIESRTTSEIREGFQYTIRNPITIVKSSLIGIFIGAVPGAGATISNFIAYGESVRSSKNKDSFGKGNPLGLLATEASNSATAAGSLVPVLAFAIPGGAASAIILGAMILHGIVPGPDLFTSEVQTTYTIFISIGLGSMLLLIFGVLIITRAEQITRVDKDNIIPIVIVLAIAGAYTLDANHVDIITVFIFGVIGYFFRMYDYSIVALVLGAILGGLIETNLFRALRASGGSYSIFVSDWISILLVLAIFAVSVGPYVGLLITNIQSRYC